MGRATSTPSRRRSGWAACDAHGRRACCCRACTSTNCCCACWRRRCHAGLFDVYAGVVRVLASEHGDALEPVCAPLNCLLLRDLGLLPTLDAETATLANLRPEGRYALVARRRPAHPPRRPIVPACRAASGVRCKGAGRSRQLCATRVPAPPWRPNSNPSCGRCCNTIAAARAAHPPADDGLTKPMTPTQPPPAPTSPHRPVRQRQQGRPGAQHAPPGHSQRHPRPPPCACRRGPGHHRAPRPDERHIRAHDVYELAELMKAWPQASSTSRATPRRT